MEKRVYHCHSDGRYIVGEVDERERHARGQIDEQDLIAQNAGSANIEEQELSGSEGVVVRLNDDAGKVGEYEDSDAAHATRKRVVELGHLRQLVRDEKENLSQEAEQKSCFLAADLVLDCISFRLNVQLHRSQLIAMEHYFLFVEGRERG